MDDLFLVDLLFQASVAARAALDGLDDWGPNADRPGQYWLDVAADGAAVGVLINGGVSVLSEESGMTQGKSGLVAVLDPIDGSTNAYRGIPLYSTSICVFDGDGARVGAVVNHATGQRFHAIRGEGAWRDGVPIVPSGCDSISESVLGLSGFIHGLGAWQYRTLGCASLEFCAVADGSLDGFVLGAGITLRPWDYLAGLLICVESGASVAELDGANPWVASDSPRRPLAAGTDALLRAILKVTAPSG